VWIGRLRTAEIDRQTLVRYCDWVERADGGCVPWGRKFGVSQDFGRKRGSSDLIGPALLLARARRRSPDSRAKIGCFRFPPISIARPEIIQI
jgi:hypothetical protein